MPDEEFWLSETGLELRLENLAHELGWKTYNGALQMSYAEAGFKEIFWVTTVQFPIGIHRKGSTCKLCFSRNGKRYRIGQFLPRIPAHPGCNCYWDVKLGGEIA